MIPLIHLIIVTLAIGDAYGGCSSSSKCGIGEGDCDWDSDCLDGLDCGGFWPSWADDLCEPGTNTVNGTWGEWSDWSDCSAICGGGVHSKTRSCDSPAPADGGFDCNGEYGDAYPQMEPETQTEACNEDPCPTCDDGIQNQDETGVDCGGSCSACPTCNDGIQNQDETGVDCGGSCDACPSCSFTVGDAVGSDYTYKKVGTTDTDDECGHLVIEKESSANGATRTQSSGNCYANFGATDTDDDSRYQSCLF